MKEWVSVLRAADAAARCHVHERRKGAAEEPYINHLLEVASLVAGATQGKNPKVVIAALLHDAIEDQEVPRELIAREFGEDVATLVEEVSDDKTLEKHNRKRIQVETAHKKSDDAKRIKLADKTSNLRAITFSAPPDWSVKRRLEYIRWAEKVERALVARRTHCCPPNLLWRWSRPGSLIREALTRLLPARVGSCGISGYLRAPPRLRHCSKYKPEA